ncbi:YbfB/YjiJ family MFS transporter [Streptomyces sp. NBC_01669]|uniref:YbfB/YjiJ family MFS transporter n=1 Tax=Streptomyces sp. NBC_01669 TaxID=2975909 RepID=UPI00225756B9|nr:YbfB/YjiJ family MFS transporter [Streptomyces sp. NBC_01669]MCX4538509.1 YbfB/YjiJ family MFS transporter [Streptomyces sp. NBC_01669]
MTDVLAPPTRSRSQATSPWPTVLRGATALAAAMGVGRFAYTPIMPLMHARAGMPESMGASLATANYIGYLAGALLGIAVPPLLRSAAALRTGLLVLAATLALMPLTHDGSAWWALRLVAGAASALVFMTATSSMLSQLAAHAEHMTGWAFGGVGAGIALSGLTVVAVQQAGSWQAAWLSCAALTLLMTAAAWGLVPRRTDIALPAAAALAAERPRTHRWFLALLTSYTLEGTGYIIAGTFLVAAIQQGAPGRIGSGAWIVVGLAALPSCALWMRLARRFSRPALLMISLSLQAVGIALPALLTGSASALGAAVLFGATFMGVSTMALAIGTHLQIPRAVALLTAGYSLGQILGPVLAAPLLRHGYHQALLLGAALVLAAACAAAACCLRFPHHLAQRARTA